jgi:hypothetical protein
VERRAAHSGVLKGRHNLPPAGANRASRPGGHHSPQRSRQLLPPPSGLTVLLLATTGSAALHPWQHDSAAAFGACSLGEWLPRASLRSTRGNTTLSPVPDFLDAAPANRPPAPSPEAKKNPIQPPAEGPHARSAPPTAPAWVATGASLPPAKAVRSPYSSRRGALIVLPRVKARGEKSHTSRSPERATQSPARWRQSRLSLRRPPFPTKIAATSAAAFGAFCLAPGYHGLRCAPPVATQLCRHLRGFLGPQRIPRRTILPPVPDFFRRARHFP